MISRAGYHCLEFDTYDVYKLYSFQSVCWVQSDLSGQVTLWGPAQAEESDFVTEKKLLAGWLDVSGLGFCVCLQ